MAKYRFSSMFVLFDIRQRASDLANVVVSSFIFRWFGRTVDPHRWIRGEIGIKNLIPENDFTFGINSIILTKSIGNLSQSNFSQNSNPFSISIEIEREREIGFIVQLMKHLCIHISFWYCLDGLFIVHPTEIRRMSKWKLYFQIC